MTRKGWHGIRRAWRHCRWAGCFEPEVVMWKQVCAYHLNEDDRLEEAFKAAQLPLPFWFLVATPPPIAANAFVDTQLDFQIPYPKLRGARGPEYYAKEQTYEEIRAEILRDIWNERKAEHQQLGGPTHGRVRKHRWQNTPTSQAG